MEEFPLFDSRFCNVRYIPQDAAVLLTWKGFCRLDDYREPTWFAAELLRKTGSRFFVVDARNGFEDDPADVEWGFSVLLPEMAKTDCSTVVFIMNEANAIEDEMDMWTKEFTKYFTVKRTSVYPDLSGIDAKH